MFQFKHLITNILASNNEDFRECIVNGTYSPDYLSFMDEIDMLEPRKRNYIETKSSRFLSDKENRKVKKHKKDR